MATDADVETPETIYRFPMPWWHWMLLVWPASWAFVLAGMCIEWLGEGKQAWRYVGVTQASPGKLFLYSLEMAGMVAAPLWAWARRRAMETNAWVRLDDDGITVSDWRRRRSHLDWGDVEQMYWRFGKASAPISTIHIRGDGQTLRIPVEDLRGRMRPLAEEIAARAGLRRVHEGWLDFGARFEASENVPGGEC